MATGAPRAHPADPPCLRPSRPPLQLSSSPPASHLRRQEPSLRLDQKNGAPKRAVSLFSLTPFTPSYSMPSVCNHVSTSRGHCAIGNLLWPQAEAVAALRVQVHLRGNAGLLQCDVIGQRLLHAVDVIVFGHQQKGRRRIGGDVDVRAQAQVGLVAGGAVLVLVQPQVAGVERRWRSRGGCSAGRPRPPADTCGDRSAC